MNIILDASAAFEIAFERNNEKAFKEQLSRASIVLAPDLYISEVTNSFWKYRNFSNISNDQCFKGIEFCISLVDDFRSTKEIWQEVINESIKCKHSAYDMFYLILARRTGGIILSCDKRLLSIAKELKIDTD